jgi:Spy/CpxP family protein refolding chaperone
MQKILMTLLALVLLSGVTLAQRGKAGMDFRQLDLTEEQKTEIKALKTAAKAKADAMRPAEGEQPNREAMRAMKEEMHQSIMAVLTPEQRAQLEAQRTARKEAWEQVDKKAMRADLKTHREKEVMPVLRAARAQLDAFIEKEDKATIDRLREVFADRKGKKAMRARGGQRAPAEGERAEARREKMEAWRAEHEEDIATLKALTEKYREDIIRVRERLAPQMKTWGEEKRAIINEYLPAELQRENRARKNKAKLRGKEEEVRTHRASKGAAGFLLMKT